MTRSENINEISTRITQLQEQVNSNTSPEEQEQARAELNTLQNRRSAISSNGDSGITRLPESFGTNNELKVSSPGEGRLEGARQLLNSVMQIFTGGSADPAQMIPKYASAAETANAAGEQALLAVAEDPSLADAATGIASQSAVVAKNMQLAFNVAVDELKKDQEFEKKSAANAKPAE